MIQGEDKGQARNLLADYITAKSEQVEKELRERWS